MRARIREVRGHGLDVVEADVMPVWDRVRDRYLNDAAFHNAVDVMQSILLNYHLSPSELREAAVLACCMVEEKTLHPMRVVVEAEGSLDPMTWSTYGKRGGP